MPSTRKKFSELLLQCLLHSNDILVPNSVPVCTGVPCMSVAILDSEVTTSTALKDSNDNLFVLPTEESTARKHRTPEQNLPPRTQRRNKHQAHLLRRGHLDPVAQIRRTAHHEVRSYRFLPPPRVQRRRGARLQRRRTPPSRSVNASFYRRPPPSRNPRGSRCSRRLVSRFGPFRSDHFEEKGAAVGRSGP